jgi:hypothetical protein
MLKNKINNKKGIVKMKLSELNKLASAYIKTLGDADIGCVSMSTDYSTMDLKNVGSIGFILNEGKWTLLVHDQIITERGHKVFEELMNDNGTRKLNVSPPLGTKPKEPKKQY